MIRAGTLTRRTAAVPDRAIVQLMQRREQHEADAARRERTHGRQQALMWAAIVAGVVALAWLESGVVLLVVKAVGR